MILVSVLLVVATSINADRRVVLPFDYRGVSITGGMFKDHLDETKQAYLRIPNDDLLLGFRRRAGLPAPGHELGGWYSTDTFHIFGQILSGLARTYAVTGDPACKAKADALLDGWTKCIGKDGYFYYSMHPNAPHYIYDKMVGGLVDMAVYAGRRDAFNSLARITGWAEKHLSRKNVYADLTDGPTEWYTLSENLYRGYIASGDDEFRQFAKVWEYTDYWRRYADKVGLFTKEPYGRQVDHYHAYSHVNTLGGAALAYRVSGNPWYLRTICNAYNYLKANEIMATGGYGPDEALVPKLKLKGMLRNTSASFETQCGCWAGFKLSKNLISLTGDAKYGDWVELLAYNGIGASIPLTPDGKAFYYSNYNPYGGKKVSHWDGWSCCAGTGPMAAADVTDLVYFHASDGLDVNLFVPSSVSFGIGGANVTVTQSTRFPQIDRTSFAIETSRPARFTMRVRRPAWLAGPVSALLNGRSVTLSSDDKNWLFITRRWTNGDRLDLTLPMSFRSVPLDSADPTFTAIAYGPVVLAFRADESPAKLIDYRHLAGDFEPVAGQPLNFRLRSDPNVLARPFYEYKEGEFYYLYLDSAAPDAMHYRALRTNGPWRDSGKHWFCNAPGAFCEGSFTGTSVRVLGYLYEDAGHAEVAIDGRVVGGFDEYGPVRDAPAHWDFSGLSPGKHTIRITVLPEKSAKSTNLYINVAGIGKTN